MKLQKASELSSSEELEDMSLLLTEVRRALKAAADHFCPAHPEKVLCSDGKERVLDDEKYLNRLQEFVVAKLPKSTTSDLLKAELKYLSSFVRRLNEMASKGVHSDVTTQEARQALVGLYFFLSNICQHITQDSVEIDIKEKVSA